MPVTQNVQNFCKDDFEDSDDKINASNSNEIVPKLNDKECAWSQTFGRKKSKKRVNFKPANNSDDYLIEYENALSIFSEVTSIRGVQKIRRSRSTFVKFLWVFFVSVMTTALVMTTGLFINEYLKYSTVWHMSTEIDANATFPSLTICPENPFSLRANKLWSEGKIESPKGYRVRVNKIVLEFLKMSRLDASSIALLDTTDQYYGNLLPEEIDELGQDKTMLAFCSTTINGFVVVGKNCDFSNGALGLGVVKFSHPKYFNCWTIEAGNLPKGEIMTDLVVLIKMVPQVSVPEAYESFVADVFTRGDGVKVVVHENGTFPDVERDGFNLQPDRINELIFTTIKKIELKTPVKYCNDDVKRMLHLDREYITSIANCKFLLKNEKLKNKCGCVITDIPVPLYRSQTIKEYPFCAHLPETIDKSSIENYLDRLNCSQKYLSETDPESERLCARRCTSYNYPLSTGISTWRPYKENLDRYERLYQSTEYGLEDMVKFLKSDISFLQESSKQKKNRSKLILDDVNSYTHIRLYRKSKDTQVELESQVSDIFILFSRIGGLCSLTIGLTTACFVELIEFCYLSRRSIKYKNKLKKQRLNEIYQNLSLNNNKNYSGGENIDESRNVLNPNRCKIELQTSV